jgi:4-diphosphocytidyl-2-C-methyl-D-erythritol kinase
VEETGYAKINLALHVRAREADGYHRIETLFAFCEHGDRLSVAPGEGLSLSIVGPFGEGLTAGEDNLVLRAARALAEQRDVNTGVALTLDKRLPVASGIGGGSADAAAALRLLCRWWDIDPGEAALLEIARNLGADVPACLLSRTMWGEGRGDRLEPVELGLAGTTVLLVNPRVPLSTAAVFAGWDGIDRGTLTFTGERDVNGHHLPVSFERSREGASSEARTLLAAEGLGSARHSVSTSLDTNGWGGTRNDLEAPARKLVPEIGEVLDALAGARLARMSGSGATCFGLFDSPAERDAASARIAASHPYWWRLATRLR